MVEDRVYESAVNGRSEFRQELRALRERAAFGSDHDATWVLYLLQDQQITVSKAREWLREWVQSGVKGPLPLDKAS